MAIVRDVVRDVVRRVVRGIDEGLDALAPFFSDLNTWHKGIDSITFAESINNLPAKFLPSIFIGDGVGYWDIGASKNLGTVHTIEYTMISSEDGAALNYVLGSGVSSFLTCGTAATQEVNYRCNTISHPLTNTGFITGKNIVKIERNGVDIILTVNGIVSNHTLPAPDNVDFTLQYFATLLGATLIANKAMLSHIKITSTAFNAEYYFNGKLNYEYDISTNGNHVTGVATSSTNLDYDIDGSTYPNTNGYSLWQLAANPDIQVPLDINGSPLNLTAGVDIPVGYTKTRDIVAGGTKWNMADALLDFDPDVGTDVKVDVFDRSNATIQNATSRASLFYDAGFPYRYQVNEIADPRTYDTFFEAAYLDRIFGKVVLDGTDLIRYDEQLNYITQKSGADLIKVTDYCKITSIYP